MAPATLRKPNILNCVYVVRLVHIGKPLACSVAGLFVSVRLDSIIMVD